MTIEDEIKNRYTQLRRGFHPTYTPNDKSSGNAWDRAADIVRGLGADPNLFVEAQFNEFSTRKFGERFPWPNQLFSASSVDIYLKYAEVKKAAPEAMMAQQNNLLAAQLSRDAGMGDIDVVLSSSALDFKSWFRLLMCSDAQYPEFNCVWGAAGRRQFMGCPTLQKFIKEKYAPRIGRFS